MPVSGGTTRKFAKASWAHPEKGIPIPIPRELQLRIQLEGIAAAEVIDLHRMIDDELNGLQRIHADPDFLRDESCRRAWRRDSTNAGDAV